MPSNTIKSVLMGVLLGPVLILACMYFLFWNEGRAVQTAQSLDEGQAAVISVDAGNVDPTREGALVHFSGPVETDDRLRDPEFPLERQALALRRHVEMYQWQEREDKQSDNDSNQTVYTYRTEWSSDAIDSSRFERTQGHENPPMPYDNHVVRAENVNLEAYQLTTRFINQLDNFNDVALDERFLTNVRNTQQGEFQLDRNRLFRGSNPANPQVGDVRISFAIIEPYRVSVIGQQSGSNLGGYQTNAGDVLNLLYPGHLTADEMFERAHQENQALTWAIRVAASMGVFIGFVMFLGPISYVARFIPLVGPMIIMAKKLVAGALTFVLAGSTIAVAWVFYRPLIGIPLLLLFIGIGVVMFRMANKNAKEAEAATGISPDAHRTP